MRRIMLALVFAAVGTYAAGDAVAGNKFVGVKGCKMCHKSAKKGDQFGKWTKGPHAKAFATLASEKAKQVAAKAGVSGDPQKAAKCLKCHVTAHGEAGSKAVPEDGVGCESCHGPGSAYKKKSVMEDHAASVAAGLIVPDEKLCKTCHNKESPTFKSFDFAKRSKQVAHPNPAK